VPSTLAAGLSLNPADLKDPVPRALSTGSALDEWVGGLPAGGLTVVRGPVRCGRTTFMLALAHALDSRGLRSEILTASPLASIWYPIPTRRARQTSLENLEDVLDHLTDEPRAGDVVLVDDVDMYGCAAPQTPDVPSTHRVRLLGAICRTLRAREVTLVMAARRGTGGRGIVFSADMILEMDLVARTVGMADGGIVADVALVKHRTRTRHEESGFPPRGRFWARPLHQRPLIFA